MYPIMEKSQAIAKINGGVKYSQRSFNKFNF